MSDPLPRGKALVEALEEAQRKGRVRSQTHPTLPLRIWNYTRETQFARDWDALTLASRALVTDGEGIAFRSYDKFFNASEPEAPCFGPEDTFVAYPKRDGSLIVAGWWEDEWIVASKGSFDSWHAREARRMFEEKYPDFLDEAEPGKTYLFELHHPANTIVVDYGSLEELRLHGIKDTATGEDLELRSRVVPFLQSAFEGKFDTTTPEKLRQEIPEDKEGWVLHTSKGKVKLKGDTYVKLHRIVSDLSPRRVWEYLSEGQDLNDLLKGIPDEYDEEIREMAGEIQQHFDSVKAHYEAVADSLAVGDPDDPEDRKQTALNFQESSLSTGVLFQCLLGKDSFDEWCWKEVKPEPVIQH